jgi:hypothetical protein
LLFFKKKGLKCFGFDPAIEAVNYGIKKDINIKHAGLDGMDVFNGVKFDIISLFLYCQICVKLYSSLYKWQRQASST